MDIIKPDLRINPESSMVKWFDPRNGGTIQSGKVTSIRGGKVQNINGAPSEANKDWVVLLSKKN